MTSQGLQAAKHLRGHFTWGLVPPSVLKSPEHDLAASKPMRGVSLLGSQ